MGKISLLFSTRVSRIDEIICGSIGLLETLFPNRIRAYYLVGSYIDGGYTAGSDIDLVPIFKGALQAGEELTYRQAVEYMDQLSPVHLGFGLRAEEQSFQEGGVGIKIGSVLLYGQDVRDKIPLTPLEQYCQSCISTSLELIRDQRGNPDQLVFPLGYPDAQAEYYGYLKDEETQGVLRKSSASIFTHLMFLASTMATLKTGQYNASKSFSWKFYQDHVGGPWGAYLEGWYIRGKKQWAYAIPLTAEERHELKQMCQKVLAFENDFMMIARDFILKRLENTDEKARDWAKQQIQKIISKSG